MPCRQQQHSLHRHTYGLCALQSSVATGETFHSVSMPSVRAVAQCLGSPIAALRHLSVQATRLGQNLGVWTDRACLKRRHLSPKHTFRCSYRSTPILLHTLPVHTHRTAQNCTVCCLSQSPLHDGTRRLFFVQTVFGNRGRSVTWRIANVLHKRKYLSTDVIRAKPPS